MLDEGDEWTVFWFQFSFFIIQEQM
jgi:hypothetical protein